MSGVCLASRGGGREEVDDLSESLPKGGTMEREGSNGVAGGLIKGRGSVAYWDISVYEGTLKREYDERLKHKSIGRMKRHDNNENAGGHVVGSIGSSSRELD